MSSTSRKTNSNRLLKACLAFLTIVVAIGIVQNYGSYFPPDFDAPFLQGRESFFWGWYSTAFFAHVISSPIALIAGLFGFSKTVLKWTPSTHRILGRLYVYLTLLVVIPSGLVIALKSYGGLIPAVSFSILGLLTWYATFRGLVDAIRRKFRTHEIWMKRSFLLMFSAVVLRVNEQLLQGFDPEIAYQVNSWISWLPVIFFFEVYHRLEAAQGKSIAKERMILESDQ